MFPWYIKYPNQNDEILNLDWILSTIENLVKETDNFINLNTIKYANPILWNITSQYEANTVVIDGQTGNAYISTKAVPTGVHLNRTDYWTQIYNYADELDNLREQIAHDEGESTSATKPYVVNDLVFCNGELYRVIAPMITGDSFVVDSNVVKTTIENELDRLRSDIDTADTQLSNRINGEISARINADTQLSNRIDGEISARTNADTQLSNRIDGEISARINADNNLALRSTFNYNKRNIICIGDSYGQFVQGSSISWISYLKDYAYNLGEFYHNELGGAGFLANLYSSDGTYKSFQDLLEMLENEIENPNNITDIIVCGGYNDLSAGHEYISQLQSKMLSFKQYANTHYPNARIYIGMIGRSTEMHICKSLITETYLYYSNACHNLGLIYLSGVETCVKSDTDMRDNVHPNNVGSITIGESILQLINGANKLYAPTITGSDISNTNAVVSSLVTLYNTSNGIDIKFDEGNLIFNSITEITYDQSNVITIGTINNQFGHVFNYQFGTTIDVKIVDTSYNFKSAIGYLYIEDRTLKLKISCLDGNNWATINTRQLLLGYGVISVAKHYY